jgi:hypothetical protein
VTPAPDVGPVVAGEGDVSVRVGQRWRPVGDGHVLEVVERAPSGWHVRFDGSGVMTIVDDGELLDPALYENATARE